MKNRLPILFILGVLFSFPVLLSAQTYNVYFGDIHSHTWYSDGNKDQDTNTYKKPVARAITYARDVANDMDYLGVSEHNHNESLNLKLGYWRSGHLEADSVNQDGTFVGLYGQEWGTISTGGHVLIYGTPKLFGWNPGLYDVFVAKGDYTALYESVRTSNGWMYLAHPNSGDFDGIFSSYHANWDSVVQGIAMKSGPALDAVYNESDPDAGNYEGLYHTILKMGYHVAPCANQDNHYTNFGMLNQQRTGVLATSLTKANINDALKSRRAYATEDHNLQLRFESGTHQMGEIFSMSGSVPLRVKLTDPGESFTSITIRYGIPGGASTATTLTSVSGRDSLVFLQPQPVNTTYYYYAYVVEADGHKAWSAPIWVTTTTPVGPPAAFDLTSPANSATNQSISGTLSWQASTGATQYDVYLGTSSPGTLVSLNQAGTTYNYSGLGFNTPYFWKVVAKNGSGNVDATTAPWTFTTAIAPPGAFALSAPASASTNQAVSGTLSWGASSGATGYDVYLSTASPPTAIVSTNQAGTTYNYSGLANSATYYWKAVAKNSGGSTDANVVPWSFTTIVANPGAFTQLSPSAGAVDRPVAGTLSWQASANAANYDVYLDTSASPTTLVSTSQAGTTYNYGGLLNSATYRWKVVARNVAGTLDAGNAPTSFTTIVASPGAFGLLTPANGATGQSQAGTLAWGTSPNAANYDVYLDTNAVPTTIVSANQTDTTFAYSGLLGGQSHRWKVVAKNAGGNVTATAAPYQFTTVNVPAAPSLVVTSNVTTSGLDLSWTDNATDETGYRVYRALAPGGPYAQLGPDLPANTVSFNDAGLSLNERYYYQIVPFNALGEGNHASIDLATMALTPGTPILSDATYLSMRVTIDPDVNPAVTQYAIRAIAAADTQYAQANGAAGSTPAWRTFAEWGGGSGVVVTGLPGCLEYAADVQARNQDNVATTFSAGAQLTLQCFTLAGSVESGWNLVSLPVIVPDPHRSVVFPTNVSSAFMYQGGYQQRDSLAQGIGYWLKFNSADPVLLGGEPGTLDSIPLVTGWNIIGSVAAPVSVGSIMELPSGLVGSSYFGYNGAYSVTDSIYPLHGYWVKANNPGTLVLSSLAAAPAVARPRPQSEEAPSVGTLTFTDGKGHSQTLSITREGSPANGDGISELPPRPPQGSFDVRFAGERLAESVKSDPNAVTALSIELQSLDGAELSWSLGNLKGVRFELSFGATTVPLREFGSVRIPKGAKSLALKAVSADGARVPSAFALHQNFPNPFNPSTEIRYELPVRSIVRMTIYSLLGVPLATLVNGEQEAGFHAVSWQPQVSSGIYLYRMEAAASENPTATFQKISRMIYLK